MLRKPVDSDREGVRNTMYDLTPPKCLLYSAVHPKCAVCGACCLPWELGL